MGIKRRLIGNYKPAIWESGGPARTRTEDQGIHFCPAVSGGSGLSLHPRGVRDAL